MIFVRLRSMSGCCPLASLRWMPKVALHFDQDDYPPAAAYAYVGASRVKFARDLFHFGRLRTSDWTPQGVSQPTLLLRTRTQSKYVRLSTFPGMVS